MAPLPKGYSLQASPIQAAISEGRTEDAKTMVVAILRSGNADSVVQALAADLLKPSPRLRGRKPALRRHWFEIGEQFHWLRDDGVKYEDAMRQLSVKFGYSETHIRNAVSDFDAAKEAHDAENRE
ncbi:hypothetical protein [Mesorhizobium sp.]|uniref:hypothetical protein n=1 Tax=Mesorhizobium sp. TaxID=1871066 RepID=UPI000FE8F51B|nr:hypothetical protein [Mesorhizobium sp.]RWF62546.1 MAG: hypothetical protein EOS47_22980 [Mesorhizobium sp.]TIT43838.1 MAG: hypothetical protein E5W76_05000 [Mesorhizobium sp.]